MCSTKASLLLVFTLAACGGDSEDDFSCAEIIGSCPILSQSYCVDITGRPEDIPDAERGCGPFTTAPCATAGTVGGCRFKRAREGGQCDIYWWFSPRTTESVMEDCTDFLPPP